ncbi:TetR/AcrR family transcriptional regulator [Geodermatophilus sp. DSM 44513]|uniref:TetR/AcrR family transcriptional regulator n=1 Tax=Geodermatophilus sp. DSM 44513 TaxID=1528104 RepID=UPI0028F7002A|nr:TetR/AcrR family transcriptional regulator [Geodermatophilus sp. DSM 44513]WNV75022.1 TetR/AcrR family transcriptional regulator [Geodermatophilus sp. DSM 44513]
MGRRPGARNRDYEQTRHALAATLSAALLRDDGTPATLVDLARAAGVSTTTLTHYFGDRDGLYAAVLEAVRADAADFLASGTSAGGRPPEETLPGLLLGTVLAWRRFGLGRVFAGGLALGLGSPRRGPAFVSGLLEPFLQAVEQLLAEHVGRGELPPLDADQRRAAALGVLSPVVLALLHQDGLGGSGVRPLDVETLARGHAALLLAGLRAS